MKRFRFRIIYIVDILLVAVMLLLDRITKQMAVSVLKDREPVSIIKGVLELFYLENRGAAFGILQDKKIFLLNDAPFLVGHSGITSCISYSQSYYI